MSEVVFNCRRHGGRTEDEVYRSNDKSTKNGFRYKCKECTYTASMKRPCKIHGDIGPENRLTSGHCKICSLSYFKKSNSERDSNRAEYNEKMKLKMEASPGLWATKQKKAHGYIEDLHSREARIKIRICQRRSISVDEYEKMMLDQNERCAICNEKETKVYKIRGADGFRLAKLALDHCHTTMKIRGFLCHDCNTGIGKFKDDIKLLQSAIEYLRKHE